MHSIHTNFLNSFILFVHIYIRLHRYPYIQQQICSLKKIHIGDKNTTQNVINQLLYRLAKEAKQKKSLTKMKVRSYINFTFIILHKRLSR